VVLTPLSAAANCPFSCDDGNDCTDDYCVVSDTCVNVANNNPCDDGDACTAGDKCLKKSCAGGPGLVCEDGNPCTINLCKSHSGCIFEPNSVSCDDGNPCTFDVCVPAAGCASKFSDGDCDDGNACTVGDSCVGGKCDPGKAADCDDGDPCTIDWCGDKGCVSDAAKDGLPCGESQDACGAAVCVGGACTEVSVEPGGSCGSVSVVGACEGHTLVRCVSGEVEIVDCAAKTGQACGWDEDAHDGEGEFACVEQDGAVCPGVPDSGVCDGEVLTWCDTDTGEIFVENCAKDGQHCGWTGSFYCCHEAKACVPLCHGRQCGDDGCGGSCGECDAGSTCAENGQCLACAQVDDGPGDDEKPHDHDGDDDKPHDHDGDGYETGERSGGGHHGDPKKLPGYEVPDHAGCSAGAGPGTAPALMLTVLLGLLGALRRRHRTLPGG